MSSQTNFVGTHTNSAAISRDNIFGARDGAFNGVYISEDTSAEVPFSPFFLAAAESGFQPVNTSNTQSYKGESSAVSNHKALRVAFTYRSF